MKIVYGHTAPEVPHRGAREEPSAWQVERMAPRVSLLDIRPPTGDQGGIGSCCAEAVVGAVGLLGRRLGVLWECSPLALYFAVRRRFGRIDDEIGCTLAQALTVAQETGLYPLELWPTDPRNFVPSEVPEDFEARSSLHRVINWGPLAHDLLTLRWSLYSGYPVLLGLIAGDAFESSTAWATGDVETPSHLYARSGHAVLALGYDDAHGRFSILNSWGPSWGQLGVGTIPYHYVLNPALCTEIQTVRAVRSTLLEVEDEPRA